MAWKLVAPRPWMFRARGVQALLELELGVRRTGAGAPLLQLPFVVLEVIVDAIELASQIIFLPCPDASQVVCQFLVQRCGNPLLPAGQVERGPGDGRVGARVDLGEIEFLGQRVVAPTLAEAERQPVQRPLLVESLDLAARQQEQEEVPTRLEGACQPPPRAAGKLRVPESFNRVAGGRLGPIEWLERRPLDLQSPAAQGF